MVRKLYWEADQQKAELGSAFFFSNSSGLTWALREKKKRKSNPSRFWIERTPVHNLQRQLFVLRVIPCPIIIPGLPMGLLIVFYRNRGISYLDFRVVFTGIKLKEAVRGVYSLHIR